MSNDSGHKPQVKAVILSEEPYTENLLCYECTPGDRKKRSNASRIIRKMLTSDVFVVGALKSRSLKRLLRIAKDCGLNVTFVPYGTSITSVV